MAKRRKRKGRIIKLPGFAYREIIFATSEVWKREAYGVIGGRGKITYFITDVLPSQTADRKFSGVESYNNKEATIEDAIKRYGRRVIGDFHSHNYYNNDKMKIGLGSVDKKFLKNHPELISVLVCTEEIDNLHNYHRIYDNIIYGPATSRDSDNKIHKLTTAFVVYYYDIKLNRILKAEIEPNNGLEKLLIN